MGKSHRKLTKANAATEIINACRTLFNARPAGAEEESNGVYRRLVARKDGSGNVIRGADGKPAKEPVYWVYVNKFQDTLEQESGGRLYPADQRQEMTDAASIKRAITSALKSVGSVMSYHGYTQGERESALLKLRTAMVTVEANPELDDNSLVESKTAFERWLNDDG